MIIVCYGTNRASSELNFLLSIQNLKLAKTGSDPFQDQFEQKVWLMLNLIKLFADQILAFSPAFTVFPTWLSVLRFLSVVTGFLFFQLQSA